MWPPMELTEGALFGHKNKKKTYYICHQATIELGWPGSKWYEWEM